jgi:hypothetical protein
VVDNFVWSNCGDLWSSRDVCLGFIKDCGLSPAVDMFGWDWSPKGDSGLRSLREAGGVLP